MAKVKRALKIKELVEWSGAETSLSTRAMNSMVNNIWMDSRKIEKGDIFLALKGDSVDGHDFVETAIKKGAAAAIVSKRKAKNFSDKINKKLIIVSNPLKAVQKMASAYREKLNYPIIAITGSNGKTTTRHFIQSVLSKVYNVGITEGNWNNHIGVPLSILKLTGEEDLAILEMGANHEKEISILSKIAKPDIAIVTNIGYAHIGNFGSLKNTAKVKLEITDGLSAKAGLLLLNGDDKILVSENEKDALYFGLGKRCGVKAEDLSVLKNGNVTFKVRGYKYSLSIPGRHFVYSALPAIFLAIQMGMPEDMLKEALLDIKPDALRGMINSKKGVKFIVDCYNANPSSMESSLVMLADIASEKKRCAIVGDMLEMGKFSTKVHKELGKKLAENKIQKVIVVGKEAEKVASSAISEGLLKKNVKTVLNADEALAVSKEFFKSGDTVLLKASRAIGLEKVYSEF